MKKFVLKIMFSLILISIFASSFNVFIGKADSTIYVDDDNVTGPWDGTLNNPYQNITSGLAHASDGDTIFVQNGTYYEHLVINKSISLIGENKHGTIIDGNITGTVIKVIADNVTITGFTIKNSGFWNYKFCGIYLEKTSNNNISHNIITYNYKGIRVLNSSHNILIGNEISNNLEGIYLVNSSYNLITYNTILNNEFGIVLSSSSNSTVFHNNFINNNQSISNSVDSTNSWDSGAEGNYWSEYTGPDNDRNGIGDQSRIIDAKNRDNYPLMGIFSDYMIVYENDEYHVLTICNSTISKMEFNKTINMLSFYVTGVNSTNGFCRIIIPRLLVNKPYTVVIDGKQVNATVLPLSNVTHTFLYFIYAQSSRRVRIFTKPYYELLEKYNNLLTDYYNLNSTLFQLMAAYDSLNETYNGVLVNYTQLLADYDALNVLYYQVQLNYTQLQANYTQLLTDFDLLNQDHQKLLANYTQLLADYDALNVLYYQVQLNYTQLQANYTQLLTDFDLLNQDHQKLLANYTQLQDNFNSLSQTYQKTLVNYTELQQNYNSLQDSHNNLVALYNSLNQTYEKLLANDTQLHKDYDSLQNSYNILLEQYDSLNSTYHEIETEYTRTHVTLSYVWIGAIVIVIIPSLLTVKYYLRFRKQKKMIEEYKRKLEQASHLGIAHTLFEADVERRGQKIKKFEQKYGVMVRPRNTLEGVIKNLELRKKKD